MGWGILQPAPTIHNGPHETSIVLMNIENQMKEIRKEHFMSLRHVMPHSTMVNKILSYLCVPGTWQTLDLPRICNLIRGTVYRIIVENRKTWNIFNDVVS